MKTFIIAAAALALAAPAIAQEQPTDAERTAAFAKCDKNTDKKLDKEEYKCVLTELGQDAALADQLWDFRDANKDGAISEEEFKPALAL